MTRIVVAAFVFLFALSSRASDWIAASSEVDYDFESIHFFEGRFVAGGFGEDSSGIVHSVDGQSWISAVLPEGFAVRAMGKGPDGLFVAGEIDGAVALCLSTDGISWTVSGGSLPVSSPVVQAEYVLGRFWLVLENGELWASADGETWEQSTLREPFPCCVNLTGARSSPAATRCFIRGRWTTGN